MSKWILLLIVAFAIVTFVRRSSARRTVEADQHREIESQLAKVTAATEEDITKFGEELTDLDIEVTGHTLDAATRQDYQRALDSYDHAKSSIAAVGKPDDIRNVTSILEDGRYAVQCVQERLAGRALPTRRPPCFFNPNHGPSTTNVSWAPVGGTPRDVPACAADAERVAAGAEPDSRQVMVGSRRVPYWQAGPAYQPMMAGYFGGFAGGGMLPGFLVGMVVADAFSGGYNSNPFDTGSGDGGGSDGGSDGGSGDGGGDSSGDGFSGSGGDSFFGGGDSGGGFDGGGDFGG